MSDKLKWPAVVHVEDDGTAVYRLFHDDDDPPEECARLRTDAERRFAERIAAGGRRPTGPALWGPTHHDPASHTVIDVLYVPTEENPDARPRPTRRRH
jgi:hypothetical protein